MTCKRCFYILLLCFCFIKQRALTQQIPLSKLSIRHIGLKEGLLFSPVKCFLQDTRGYMWMGGKALQRYDGYRFKNYFDGSELLTVQCLFEDKRQNIWAGTDKGVYQLNRSIDSFKLFQDSIVVGGKKQLLNVSAITDDGGGRVWFGGLNFYALLNSTDVLIEDAYTLFDSRIVKKGGVINKDGEGNLWFRFQKPYGIIRYNWKTNTITSHFRNPLKEEVFDLEAGNAYVLSDENQNIWFTESYDQRSIFRYNTGSKKLFQYKLSYPPGTYKNLPAVPGRFFTDSRGTLWVTIEERMGIARYLPAKDSFEYLYTDNDKKSGLHDFFSVTNPSGGFYEDKQGNFWQGGNEVNFFSPYKQAFQTFRLSDYKINLFPGDNGSMSSTAANSFLLMPDNKLYIAFYGDGLWRFNNDLEPEKKIKLPDEASNMLWNIYSPDKRNIFIADQYKKNSSSAITAGAAVIKNYRQLANDFIVASLRESDSSAWLGHWSEAFGLFNPFNDRYTNFKYLFTSSPEIRVTVYNFCRLDSTHIWIAASNGLHLFSSTEKKIVKTWNPGYLLQKGGRNLIRHISRLNEDTLFLCSDNGFIIYNPRKNTARILTIRDGMPDNICYSSIIEKNRKFVWINTSSKGPCRLYIPEMRITTFHDNDGVEMLNGSEASFEMPDGKLLFANNNGFTAINPELIHKNFGSLKPVLSEVLINGKNFFLPNTGDQPVRLSLQPEQNTLSISFSTLDFFNIPNQSFSVKLKGIDTGWMNIGQRAQVEYRNLPPGQYTLLIISNNDDLLRTAEITSLVFTIHPPFWRRWWFYTIAGVLLGTIIYFLYRYRIKNIRKQEMLKAGYDKLVSETELKALRSQMNPHFIFNSLNAINRYILKSDRKEAAEYLSKFSKLIRLILDNSRQARIPLSQELSAVQLYLELETLRFQNNFSYNIFVNEDVSPEWIFIPPMLIQPIVENAIWHGLLPKGSDTSLNIQLYLDGMFLDCVVEDNGIGRQKSAELKQEQVLEKSSIGISATEQRLQLLSRGSEKRKLLEIIDLTGADGHSAGTRVILHIPYSNKPVA